MPTSESSTVLRRGTDIARLIRFAETREAVRREDLEPGDWMVVATKNSEYLVGRDGSGRFVISGGFFDQTGEAPIELDIRGCTFGGRAIWTEILAARGLFLEFANGVRTTRIQEVRTLRGTPGEMIC